MSNVYEERIAKLTEDNNELTAKVDTLTELLQDCMSTMGNCHAYDTDSYHNANRYLYGEGE
ncbi:hypothetical protein BK703_16535 [Bacillus thuringiensis serovar silo]|uniref:hypothetical protein n=1 Tax=Bacillus thuringiensis TaxID=1428 RepID=UPI000A368AFA|nr:hypothetical protein [Bacillus thuringiensis]MDA2128678.1 hypothetical protein [Bacillus cereus]MED3275378.1 hypothetical protein [Bacillus thuringiensis]OTW55247.1 hypothetical protein BK703_16535 [Bacillus thuringiensis serovar silo]OTW74321.1 hypothetical protein BK700_01510 [Bacillus thuringiensis serovar toguchini]